MFKETSDYIEGLPLEFAHERCGYPEDQDLDDPEEKEHYEETIKEYIDDLKSICADGEYENQIREQGYIEGYTQSNNKIDLVLAKLLESELEDTYEHLLGQTEGREVLGKGLCEEDKNVAEEIYQKIMGEPNNQEFEAGKIAGIKYVINLFNLK